MARSLQHYARIIRSSGLGGEVEICISDNSPDSRTRSAVQKFMGRGGLQVSYRQNKSNLGFDRNACLALKMGRGEYLHLLSDEEIYNGRMLRDIIDHFREGDCDCVYSNPSVPQVGSASELAELEAHPQKILGIGSLYLSLFCLSTLIIKRAQFEKFARSFDLSKFNDTYFLYAPVYLYALSNCRRLLALRTAYSEMPSIAYKAHLPHDYATTFDLRFFLMMKQCAGMGVISKEEFERFKRDKYLMHAVRGMLLYRTYIFPQIHKFELGPTDFVYSKLQEEWGFGRMGNALFSALRAIVFTSIIPYHWAYAAYFFIKKHALGHKGMMDRRSLYRSILIKKSRSFELGMDRK